MNLVGPDKGLFSEDELKVLHSVGNQVASALDRAHLHEHLEQLVEKRTAALEAEIAERTRIEKEQARLVAIIEATPDLIGTSDPDGNSWLLQEVTVRLPGRVDADHTTFTSSTELAATLRRAATAHGEHEKRTGQHDADWPDWYAEYIVREQAGKELPNALVTLALGNGFILTAMLWGAFLAEMIDRRLKVCALYLGILAVFSLFGLVHSPLPDGSMSLPWALAKPLQQTIAYQFSAAYLVLALLVLGLSFSKESREAPLEH